MSRFPTYEVNVEGGWASRNRPPDGEDDRVLAIRVNDPGNGTLMFELEIPARYVIDLLSNRHNSHARASLEVIAGLDKYGHVREFGHLIVPGIDWNGREVRLPGDVLDLLGRGQWTWDKASNMHRRTDDGYQLDISRVVPQSVIDVAPATVLRDQLHDVVKAGLIRTRDGVVVRWGYGKIAAKRTAKKAAASKRTTTQRAAVATAKEQVEIAQGRVRPR